jgi:hypothetical protein
MKAESTYHKERQKTIFNGGSFLRAGGRKLVKTLKRHSGMMEERDVKAQKGAVPWAESKI